MKIFRRYIAVSPENHLAAESPPSQNVAYVRQVLRRLANHHGEKPRYTVAKFRSFYHYASNTSSWRHALVITLTPLPSFFTSILPVFIPLQDPALGVIRNPGFLVQFFLTMAVVIFGSVLQVRAPNAISHADISNLHAVVIAVVGGLLITAFVFGFAKLWRFPIPFIWITVLVPFISVLILAHVIVLYDRLRRSKVLRYAMIKYIPAYILQASQVVIYPVFSAIFEIAGAWGQVLLTLMFPVVKHLFRAIVRKLLGHLREDANEVAVSGVEICAVMYQSMIMQNSPSPYATAIIMGLDAAQSLFTIYILMAKHSVIPQAELIPSATKTLCQNKISADESCVDNRGSESSATIPAATNTRLQSMLSIGVRSTRLSVEKANLVQALEIMQSAESILIIEYFEVTVPIVNAGFILLASQLESAIFNPKIRPYYYDQDRLVPVMKTLALYTFLQALSLVMVYLLLRRHFNVSAQPLLAYVLERHAWSLQGKLITWLIIILQFPVAHYGVDFNFKFDFSLAKMVPSP